MGPRLNPHKMDASSTQTPLPRRRQIITRPIAMIPFYHINKEETNITTPASPLQKEVIQQQVPPYHPAAASLLLQMTRSGQEGRPAASIIQGISAMKNNHNGERDSDNKMTPLPHGFTPGPFDVICARGAKVKQHTGNLLFRRKVEASVQAYADATSKFSKSMVVSNVVDFFRELSAGGFVKKESSTGVWYAVSENLAREKVGQAIREQLSHKYRSSTKAKRRRWRQQQQEEGDDDSTAAKASSTSNNTTTTTTTKIDYDDLISSNAEITNAMNQLSHRLQQEASKMNDESEELLKMFTENNIALLQIFQTDDAIRATLRARSSANSSTSEHTNN